jgi:hypothetical protein
MADIPLDFLKRAVGEIIFSAKLYQCDPFYLRFPAKDLDHALMTGQQVARLVNRRLADRATKDKASFEHLRERIRRKLVAILGGEPPPPDFDDEDPKSLMGLALLWLALHEPYRNHVLRQGLVECLPSAGRVIIEIACGEKIAYVTTVGVNPQRNLDQLMRAAETAPGPFVIVHDHRTGNAH